MTTEHWQQPCRFQFGIFGDVRGSSCASSGTMRLKTSSPAHPMILRLAALCDEVMRDLEGQPGEDDAPLTQARAVFPRPSVR